MGDPCLVLMPTMVTHVWPCMSQGGGIYAYDYSTVTFRVHSRAAVLLV